MTDEVSKKRRLYAETRAAAAEARLEVLENRRPWWGFWENGLQVPIIR